MTLAQFVEVVRRRHRAESDSNWSDAEIYQLITGRCNEVLSIIGLLETTGTDVTVIGTQAYNWPSDAVRVVQVNWNGEMLQEISFREWELNKAAGLTNSGDPEKYAVWARQIQLIPVPSAAGKTITFFYEKEHPYIDGSGVTTISIPAVLHFRLADGVVADMFSKDLNVQMAQFYEQKWLNVHIPAFQEYSRRSKRGSRFRTVVDSDTFTGTDHGVV